MFIGDVEINGYCALAPMAGVADRAFRELCREMGAAYTVGEMVSAKGVSMNDRKSKQLMYVSPEDHPTAIQLFGDEPQTVAEAARFALTFKPDIIDINMGCPAPKIVKNGSGSALMRKPGLAGKIIRAVADAVDVPVTVKIRTGWDKSSINCVYLAELAEANGAAAVAVHGRTKEQMYAPPVDVKLIAECKKAIRIPVIGNGDIFTPEDAKAMYEHTGCDLIMVGRGALGAPWIFGQINEYLTCGEYSAAPTVSERMNIMLDHASRICSYSGSAHGICEVRKHALWYTKGLKGGAKYREALSTVKTFTQLKEMSELIIAEQAVK